MGIDGDGVEGDAGSSALNVEDIEEVFDADVVGCECGRVVAREAGLCAGDGADGVSVGGGIDEDDAAGGLEGFEEGEAACTAVEEFDAFGQCKLLQGVDGMDADAFIAHENVAEADNEGLFQAI